MSTANRSVLGGVGHLKISDLINKSMRYTVYKTTNTLNGKYYIGKHQTDNPMDDYIGSGRAIQNAVKTYGRDAFVKEVLFDFDTEEDMNLKEKELITEDIVNDPMSYNMGIGGEGGPHFKGRKHTEETKRKQSESSRGKSNDYDRYSEKRTKTFFARGNTLWKNREQKPVSEDTKSKIREKRKIQVPPNLGRKMSEEQKEKIRQSILKRNAPV